MVKRKITLPLSEDVVRSLHVGDMVLLTGRIVTGRDRFHKGGPRAPLPLALQEKLPELQNREGPQAPLPSALQENIASLLKDGVLYHTGPIIREGRVLAAGPTTSIRMDMYEPGVIERYGIRGVMGKGGMGKKTLEAMKKFGCVYFLTFGGAAVYLADRVKAVAGSFMLEEWGEAEAVWILDIEDFPAVVTMDAHGRSLHEEIEETSCSLLRAQRAS